VLRGNLVQLFTTFSLWSTDESMVARCNDTLLVANLAFRKNVGSAPVLMINHDRCYIHST